MLGLQGTHGEAGLRLQSLQNAFMCRGNSEKRLVRRLLGYSSQSWLALIVGALRRGNASYPLKENVNDFAQFEGAAECGEFVVLYFAMDPLISACFRLIEHAVLDGFERFSFKHCINEIDRQAPARIVQSRNRYSVGVLPIFVALV
jgi:hypothetical protein